MAKRDGQRAAKKAKSKKDLPELELGKLVVEGKTKVIIIFSFFMTPSMARGLGYSRDRRCPRSRALAL